MVPSVRFTPMGVRQGPSPGCLGHSRRPSWIKGLEAWLHSGTDGIRSGPSPDQEPGWEARDSSHIPGFRGRMEAL